jgi:DNA-directed RNA polymerase subunit RPC12/RpoP
MHSMRDRNYEALVRDGITAAKNGNQRLAFSLLNQATQMDASDPRPWLWLTETTDDLTEKCEYLENAVVADPRNASTRQALAVLQGKLEPGQPATRGTNFVMQPSEEPIKAQTKETFLCPQCGGHVEFNPQENRLTCRYCGYAPKAEEERSAADAERSMLEVLPTESGHRWAASQQHLHCQRCGADSLWPPEQKAIECPYCGSHQLISSAETEALVDPQAIAIMQIEEQDAIRRVQDWFGRGWFAPDDLTQAAKRRILHPAYYPFWTFDGTLELHWSCEVNEGGSNQYQNWVSRTGVECELFNDVLIPGLERLNLKELRKLGPYNLMDVVEFKPEYLAGWPALTYDRPLAKASLMARERVVRDLRRHLHNRVMPGQQKRRLQPGGVNWVDMTFKYVLLPLWIGTYHYQGQEYQVIVNGQTGKVSGEKPRDIFKTILIVSSVVASLLVVLIFLALAGFEMGWLGNP